MFFHECKVRTIVCACLDSTKIKKDEDSLPFVPINLNVEYDFCKKVAMLEFSDKYAKEYSLKSIEVIYEFRGYKLPDEILECVVSSKSYKFSTKEIKRHVLYDNFLCKSVVSCEGSTYKMDFAIAIPYFESITEIRFGFFETYFPPDKIVDIFNKDFTEHSDLTSSEGILLSNLQNRSLKESKLLEYAVNIEDLTQQKALEKFTLLDVKIKAHRDDMKSFKVSKELPPNVKENSLCLIPMNKYEKSMINKENDCIFANIDDHHEGTFHFKKRAFYDRNAGVMRGEINTGIDYAIRFIPNRITYRASLHAMEKIREFRLEDFFEKFQEEPYHKKENHRFFEAEEFKWFNSKIDENKEQKIAITNIVNSSAFPFPYVIFGPPGTGKTSCIIECIAQILKFKPESKIFVTAQSNSACDEVGERLLQYFDISQIYRYYTPSILMRSKSEINKNLVPSSNIRNPKKSDELPSEEELKHFQIVICTLTSSSKFERANLSKHFKYIFIDECAATTEPEALISILGMGCVSREVFSNIVLIGDHKQLPAVVTSEFAKNLGLGVSLMERMMQTERYKANPEYDNRYVTQLLDNYRSHPAILHFSNVKFYDSKLRAKNESDEVMLGTKWQELPNKDFPIIFHTNKSSSELVMNGTSSYNEGEVDLVLSYVNKLLGSKIGGRKIVGDDIGVVTPYLAQREKLKRILPKDVEIGTSEYYQGREKLIIIISTVKSKAGVGFLSDERRLNVCLTRAKALMIVIGNPDTLQQDKLWKSFVLYCKKNKALIDSSTIKENKLSFDGFCRQLEGLKVAPTNVAATKTNQAALYSNLLKKMDRLDINTFPSLN